MLLLRLLLATLTATEQVTQAREREREAGCPAVPHNSLDLSVIDLSETVAEVAVDTLEVFQDEEVEELPLSPPPRREVSATWGDATLDLLLQDSPRRQDSTRTSPRVQQLNASLDLLLQDTPRRRDTPRRQDSPMPRRQDSPRTPPRALQGQQHSPAWDLFNTPSTPPRAQQLDSTIDLTDSPSPVIPEVEHTS